MQEEFNRISLIQGIFKKTGFNTYLEIGSEGGGSLLPVKAWTKTAVDPHFQVTRFRKLKWLLRQPRNINNRYFEETSDSFFENQKKYLKRISPIDVVFIDGLHTFRASLNDVRNSLDYLNPQGFIILHDCLPPHEAAALPTDHFPTEEDIKEVEGWTMEWCGDVWKTIFYLRKYHKEDFEVFVIDADYGIGILKPKPGVKPSSFDIDKNHFEEIKKLTYQDLMANKEEYLGLKSVAFARELINKLDR